MRNRNINMRLALIPIMIHLQYFLLYRYQNSFSRRKKKEIEISVSSPINTSLHSRDEGEGREVLCSKLGVQTGRNRREENPIIFTTALPYSF